MCHCLIQLDCHSYRDVQHDFTSTTFSQLHNVITRVVDLDHKSQLEKKLKKTSIICMSCFTLLDKLDEIQDALKVCLYLYIFNILKLYTVKRNFSKPI